MREQQNLPALEGIQTSRLVRLTGDGTPVGLQAYNGAIRFSPHASFDTVALAASELFAPRAILGAEQSWIEGRDLGELTYAGSWRVLRLIRLHTSGT